MTDIENNNFDFGNNVDPANNKADQSDIKFEDPKKEAHQSEISLNVKVLGLGGAGLNIIEAFSVADHPGVTRYALDSDARALETISKADTMLVGQSICRGLGCGGDFKTAEKAVEANKAQLMALIEGVDVLILIAGLGGGIGSALAEKISALASNSGVLTLGFFMQPFSFEGARFSFSESIRDGLRPHLHGLFSIPNDLLIQEGETHQTALVGFERGNAWILNSLRLMINLLYNKGIIDQDLGALKRVFSQQGGKSFFAVSDQNDRFNLGEDSIAAFVDSFLLCPLFHLEVRPENLDNLLIIIKGGQDLELSVIHKITSEISKKLNFKKDLNVGAFIDPSGMNSLEVCIFGKTEIHDTTSNASPSSDLLGEDQAGDSMAYSKNNPERGKSNKRNKVHRSKLTSKLAIPLDQQEEFGFFDKDQNRGYFQDTDKNMYKGLNLDRPTYLRKGIKIRIK